MRWTFINTRYFWYGGMCSKYFPIANETHVHEPIAHTLITFQLKDVPSY